MKPGFQHLLTLSLIGERIASGATRADAYAIAGDHKRADESVESLLKIAEEAAERVTAIREARGEETAQDAFAKVLAGKSERIAKPGQWVVYREGGKVICEVQSDEA